VQRRREVSAAFVSLFLADDGRHLLGLGVVGHLLAGRLDFLTHGSLRILHSLLIARGLTGPLRLATLVHGHYHDPSQGPLCRLKVIGAFAQRIVAHLLAEQVLGRLSALSLGLEVVLEKTFIKSIRRRTDGYAKCE
jgi:hypothetical protein